ncbi:hypothetical protein GCM10009525_49280 [Streptosporangium amethystogenes subsp. fukuiense]
MIDHDVDDIGRDQWQQPGGAVLEEEGEDRHEQPEAVLPEEIGERTRWMLTAVAVIESANHKSPK